MVPAHVKSALIGGIIGVWVGILLSRTVFRPPASSSSPGDAVSSLWSTFLSFFIKRQSSSHATSRMSPPGIKANWSLGELKPEVMAKVTEDLIEVTRKKYDSIGQLGREDVSLKTCLEPLMDLECAHGTEESPLDFAQHCAAEKSIRDASVEAAKRLNEFSVEVTMRKDIFDRVSEFRQSEEFKSLSEEKKRFVEKEIVHGRRNGLHLSQRERDEITEVKKKISELGTVYLANLNEDNSFLEFAEEELAGVPEDLVKSFEKTESGKLKVTMKYPHFFPVTRKCRVPETRKKMEKTYQARCMEENTKLLEQLIQLRQKQATLLGYDNHASYVQELRMAKNPGIVAKFLSDLSVKLQPIWKAELEAMIKLKKEECEKYGYEFSGALDFWDIRYYMTQVEELHYAVDQEKLKEYFPMEKVTRGLLEIYQGLLGLTFVEVKEADVWHPDVKLYQVDDTATKETLGYFFLDLYPRDGKYGHAAIFDLQPNCLRMDGTRQVGVCAMMTNFAKPTQDKPSLLDHGEVETYFHEFGHVMHMLCSRTETAKFRGTHVERDFVEAPSQMLENWVWQEESLRKMSGHYKDNSEIPRTLLDKLIASRRANAGGFNLRQIILATFDQRIHTTGEADSQELFSQIYEELVGIKPIPGTNMPANWGHMVGYDAQYYGYLWSEVFSFDMFETRFRQEGLMNPEVGLDYRRKILQPGGSKDADQLLLDFLGRPANEKAFLKAKGLGEN